MFRGLTKFSYQRTPLQAFGWYLTFLLIMVVIAAVFGSLGFIERIGEQTFQMFALKQMVIIALCHIVLGTTLLWNRPKSIANVLLVLLGVALSPLGSLGGLIPFAVLTTRPSNISPDVKKVFE